eukprot:2654581-Rhodomonas_salina.1
MWEAFGLDRHASIATRRVPDMRVFGADVKGVCYATCARCKRRRRATCAALRSGVLLAGRSSARGTGQGHPLLLRRARDRRRYMRCAALHHPACARHPPRSVTPALGAA